MGAVKDMLMDVEDFVYGFYDENGIITETYPVIIRKAREKFGPTFGDYAEEVLIGDSGPDPDYRMEEMEYRQSLSEQLDDSIPF